MGVFHPDPDSPDRTPREKAGGLVRHLIPALQEGLTVRVWSSLASRADRMQRRNMDSLEGSDVKDAP